MPFCVFVITKPPKKALTVNTVRAKMQKTKLFHPDYTVGYGISPYQPPNAARGLYRRWGISPRPECFFFIIIFTFQFVNMLIAKNYHSQIKHIFSVF